MRQWEILSQILFIPKVRVEPCQLSQYIRILRRHRWLAHSLTQYLPPLLVIRVREIKGVPAYNFLRKRDRTLAMAPMCFVETRRLICSVTHLGYHATLTLSNLSMTFRWTDACFNASREGKRDSIRIFTLAFKLFEISRHLGENMLFEHFMTCGPKTIDAAPKKPLSYIIYLRNTYQFHYFQFNSSKNLAKVWGQILKIPENGKI